MKANSPLNASMNVFASGFIASPLLFLLFLALGVVWGDSAKISRRRCRIYEVGISYYGRTYVEGKQIGWRDGLRAIWCILKYTTWARG